MRFALYILPLAVVLPLLESCSGDSGNTFGDTNSGTNTGTGTGSIGAGTLTGGGGSIGSGSGSGSGSGGSSFSADAACVVERQGSSSIPTDIFIMLDKSGSMDCSASDDACSMPENTVQPPPSRWEAVTNAITGFVNAPGNAGIGVGIGFFPLGGGSNCTPAAYARPTVPIAALPGSAMPIIAAIGMNGPNGGTPTVPALDGALQYAQTYTRSTAGRAAAVVFVTDGIPNGCTSTVPAAATLAQGYFGRNPSIKTYVVGLGATMSLDQIALAGSGNVTHYFPASGDVAGRLGAALRQITGMITCNFTLPMNPARPIDFTTVNVQVTMGTGTPRDVGRVENAAACGSTGGWYYNVNPPAGVPTQLTLCSQVCDPLKNTPESSVQVLLGCNRN